MAERMPPPGGKPSVVIAVGTARKQPPGGAAPPDAGSGKVSPEDAGLVLDAEHCIDCTMYHVDTGECDKVEGTMSPQDGCSKYFEAREPDADDKGGAPDQDQDDQPPPQGAAQ